MEDGGRMTDKDAEDRIRELNERAKILDALDPGARKCVRK